MIDVFSSILRVENVESNANTTKSSDVSTDDGNKTSTTHGESYFGDKSSEMSSDSWSISSLPSYTEELKQLYAGVGTMELGGHVKSIGDFDADDE